MRLVPRRGFRQAILTGLSRHPAVSLLGPRQCGKTTLAKGIAAEQPSTFFDLERPADRRRLENAEHALTSAEGLVVIDEIQRDPGLFEVLRVLIDRWESKGRFLLLGSASPHVVRGAFESLAGRVGFVDLTGFRLDEVEPDEAISLWTRGGFPRSFLAESEAESYQWRESFLRTFLERDVPQLGISIPAPTLRRFWTMVAHYHGQVWNAAEFARSLGSSEGTARRHLDILTGAAMVRQLQPWHENIRKRQVKAPKIYVRDTGLLHTLLTLENHEQLTGHPKVGASWEGFAIEQLIAALGSENVYFWATHSGAELDLLALIGGRRFGFEVKYTDAPGTTRSLRIAANDLALYHSYVVYPGSESYPLDRDILALSIRDVPTVRTRLSAK